MTLEEITGMLRERVENHAPINTVIKFELEGLGIARINGAMDPTEVDNVDSAADCVVKVSASAVDNFISGSLNPQMAFFMGEIQVDGDLSILLQLGGLLG